MAYRCYKCGRRIGFLNPKPKSRRDKAEPIMTDGVKRYFLPNDREGDLFYDKYGNKRLGKCAADGLEGYYPHKCG